jgi:hypothetical protein
MAESGCTLNEIMAQSRHKNVSTVFGYVQHLSNRIKKAYEPVFANLENNQHTEYQTPQITNITNNQYKKVAMQKFLDGEIDAKTLHSVLTTIEIKENTKPNTDPTYV